MCPGMKTVKEGEVRYHRHLTSPRNPMRLKGSANGPGIIVVHDPYPFDGHLPLGQLASCKVDCAIGSLTSN